MKEDKIWSIGGYVRTIVDGRHIGSDGINDFKKDDIYQIKDYCNSTGIITTINSEVRLCTRTGDSTYPIECEWIGMEVPVKSEIINTYSIF